VPEETNALDEPPAERGAVDAGATIEPPTAPPPVAGPMPEHVPPRFGAPGSFVVSGGSVIGIASTSFSGSEAQRFAVTFAPTLDYFIVKDLFIGLEPDIGFAQSRGYGADSSLIQTKSTTYSGAVRVGANLPLGERFSLRPHVAFGVESVHTSESLVSGSSLSVAGSVVSPATTQTGAWVAGQLPLLFHVAPHFFVGFGPTVFHQFARTQEVTVGGERTTFGAGLLVGGHVGGADEAVDAPPPPPPTGVTSREPAFGEPRQIVLSSALGASVSHTTYAGTEAATTSASVYPAFDYFVADHVSLGVSLGASYGNTTGFDASNGATVTYKTSSFSVGGRVGRDLPITRSLSFYPRASLSAGTGSTNEESSRGSANDDTDIFFAVGVYAPLLVHPAPHLFVGFGPQASTDLLHEYNDPRGGTKSILATQVGASLVVGGWL